MPLSQTDIYQGSRQGFQTKLNAIGGIFEAVRGAQIAKQQMSQQLDAQKELIDYKTDAQFNLQKQVYEEIQKPQLEARAQAQQQEQIQKALADADKTANQRLERWTGEFSNVRRYNLLGQINFRPRFDAETGQVSSVVYRDGEEVSYENYIDFANQAKRFGSWLSELESQVDQLPEAPPVIDDEGTFVIDRKNAHDVLNMVKTNPQQAQQMWQLFESGKLKRADSYIDQPRNVDDSVYGIVPLASQLNTLFGGSSTKTFAIDKRWGFNLLGKEHVVELDIDNESIGSITHKIESFFDGLGYGRADLMSEEGRAAIRQKLHKVDPDLMVDELLSIYTQLPLAYNEFLQATGGVVGSTGQALGRQDVRFNRSFDPTKPNTMFMPLRANTAAAQYWQPLRN
jgi:phage gp36-like protein